MAVVFQSTLSMRRATRTMTPIKPLARLFQSTLSMRRATFAHFRFVAHHLVISIHALHEESDQGVEGLTDIVGISIHALHEESDQGDSPPAIDSVISIHALHEESDVRG